MTNCQPSQISIRRSTMQIKKQSKHGPKKDIVWISIIRRHLKIKVLAFHKILTLILVHIVYDCHKTRYI